jgi:phosphohistidine phosphatase
MRPAEEIDATAMRRLMLLRHAKAERPAPGTRDRERSLTERGRADAPVIGAYMARHGLMPDRVLVSTATRTRQTWGLIARTLSHSPVAHEDRLYDASTQTILDLIKQAGPDVHGLLVIGHNPGLHDLARLLIASGDVEAREQLNEKLPTSGLAVIEFAVDDWPRLHPRSGRLDRFVTPSSLQTKTE